MTDHSTTAPPTPAQTKIGTEVIGVKVISGSVTEAEPGTVVLHQLYPGTPTTIGVVDSITDGTGQTTIYPAHRRDWTAVDRLRLAEFFATRYCERLATNATAAAPTNASLTTPGGDR
ncbi:hypothetical protein [Glycomyces sp. NPDC048151]|uniref:hypothetical protein n=1 Tax=Glycomyces sp. NPDC048151 TaxID=3364002 RepID=UPI0037238DF3